MKTIQKTASLVLSGVLMAGILAGCQGNRESSTEMPVQSSGSSASPEGNNPDSGVIKEGTIPKDGNVILKELAFVYKDQTIALSDIVDAAKLEGMLGKAEEIESHTYTAGDGTGMDQLVGRTKNLYKFPGLEIETFNTGEGTEFYITQIVITDPAYATVRNIKVGDSIEELKKGYPEGNLTGNGATSEEDEYRYTPANYVDVMTFHIKDAKIDRIRISTLLD